LKYLIKQIILSSMFIQLFLLLCNALLIDAIEKRIQWKWVEFWESIFKDI